MVTPDENPVMDKSKTKNKDNYGFWAVVAGLATLVVAVMLAVFRYQTAIEATGLVTAVGTVVGTVVGAYFGIHAGTAAAQNTQAGAMEAVKAANALTVRAALAVAPGSDEARAVAANL